MSKPSYATYIKDRLDGFGGTGNTFVYQDLADFPRAGKARVRRSRPLAPQDAGLQRRRSACATRRRRAPTPTISKAALAGVKAHRRLHERGLARRHLAVLPQRPLPEPRELISTPSPRPCATNTRPSPRPASCLQIDCPDLAMGRHIQYADLEPAGIPQARGAARRGAQPRASPISRPSSCACMCAGAITKARIIATCRSPTSSTSCFRPSPRAISFEAANPRHAHEWTLFEKVKLPDGKVLIPGVIESKSNFIEHPGADRAAHRALRQAGRPRERHRRLRLRLRHLGRAGRGRSRRGVRQARGHGGRREDREPAVLEITHPVIPGRPPKPERRRRTSPESRAKRRTLHVALDSGFARGVYHRAALRADPLARAPE